MIIALLKFSRYVCMECSSSRCIFLLVAISTTDLELILVHHIDLLHDLKTQRSGAK